MLPSASAFRPRRCKHCREKFVPERIGQQVHWECVQAFVEALKAKERAKAERERKAKAKVERAQIKARRRELETIPELIKAAQKEFNAYVRLRDAGKPCICCGEPLGTGEVGGAYDCGHWRSVGSAPHLRFDERNAHGQRKQCNRWGAGRAVDYRLGLIERIGLAAVEAIEADQTIRKWTREELRQIRETYKEKRLALEKENT